MTYIPRGAQARISIRTGVRADVLSLIPQYIKGGFHLADWKPGQRRKISFSSFSPFLALPNTKPHIPQGYENTVPSENINYPSGHSTNLYDRHMKPQFPEKLIE